MAWYSSWGYRKKVTITGQSGAGTDYQVRLLIGATSSATGENFDLAGHSTDFPSVSNDGGDLVFTASDGTTLLDFWVESVSGSGDTLLAIVWVKVEDSLESNVDIYCYYGKSGATNASNGSNTFLFFDDFSGDLSKWTIDSENTDCMIIDNGYLRHNPDSSQTHNSYSDTRGYVTTLSISDFSLHYKVFLGGGTNRKIHQFGWRTDGLTFNSGYCWRLQNSGADGGYFRFASATWSTIGTSYGAVSADTWYGVEVHAVGSAMETFIGGSSVRTLSDSTTSSGALTSHVHGVSLGVNDYVLVDDVFVRKNILTEPSYSSSDSEEILTSGTNSFFALF